MPTTWCRAREAILAHGGAETVNVFTRILLALFGVVSWRAVPMMPVEIMLLPQWFPFHLSKVSYWARTVIVPLLVLNAKRPVARNPRRCAHRRAVPRRAGQRPACSTARAASAARVGSAFSAAWT